MIRYLLYSIIFSNRWIELFNLLPVLTNTLYTQIIVNNTFCVTTVVGGLSEMPQLCHLCSKRRTKESLVHHPFSSDTDTGETIEKSPWFSSERNFGKCAAQPERRNEPSSFIIAAHTLAGMSFLCRQLAIMSFRINVRGTHSIKCCGGKVLRLKEYTYGTETKTSALQTEERHTYALWCAFFLSNCNCVRWRVWLNVNLIG